MANPNQFSPQGLVPVQYGAASAWNSQLNGNYTIASGYANNIFVGDLVAVSTAGTIINLADLTSPTFQSAYSLGVFAGCNFTPPTGINAITAPQGHKYWPAGTQTLNGVPAQAFVRTDPFVMYSIQSGGANPVAITAALAQQTYGKVVYQFSSGTIVAGNTTTGTSSMYVDFNLTTVGGPFNLKSWYLDPETNNSLTPYNNIICTLALNAWFAPSPLLQR